LVETPPRIDVAQVLIERDGKVLVVHTLIPDSNIDRWGYPAAAAKREKPWSRRQHVKPARRQGSTSRSASCSPWASGYRDARPVRRFPGSRRWGPSPAGGRGSRGVPLDLAREADALMPWYPGGVRALLEGRVGYYIDRSSA
jgi:hypothetical protein